jgi:hypothetical protein
VLDVRPFESLVSTTFEGLKIAPPYPRATVEGTRALRHLHGHWKISQRMDHPSPETANQMARAYHLRLRQANEPLSRMSLSRHGGSRARAFRGGRETTERDMIQIMHHPHNAGAGG